METYGGFTSLFITQASKQEEYARALGPDRSQRLSPDETNFLMASGKMGI